MDLIECTLLQTYSQIKLEAIKIELVDRFEFGADGAILYRAEQPVTAHLVAVDNSGKTICVVCTSLHSLSESAADQVPSILSVPCGSPMSLSQVPRGVLEIFGRQYVTDSITNVPQRVLDCMQRKLYRQRENPLYLISERIKHFFCDSQELTHTRYPYEELQYESPVVSLHENFDSLLIPKDHVSRRPNDTYYVNSQNLLRSHSSAHQAESLAKGSRAFISIADCYRRDEIDRSHYPAFHQCEVFKLYSRDESLPRQAKAEFYDTKTVETPTKQAIYSQEASNFAEAQLKSAIEKFVQHFFNQPDLQTRWVNAYFPFTHPSFELEIFWRNKWIEVLGCGVVRDELLRNAGIRDHVGFAAGFGLERFGMLKYEIPDIRLFWTRDTGFTHQFEGKGPFDEFKFKPISTCPQCINDLSFWLPVEGETSIDASSLSPNDFYDLFRTIGGDLIEQVKLTDVFKHPKTNRTSHCYRIVYRAADRVLTKEEVNVIHQRISDACREHFHVEIR